MSKNKLLGAGAAVLATEAERPRRVPRAADSQRDPALPQQTDSELKADQADIQPKAGTLLPAAYEVSTLDGMDEAAQITALEDAYRSADNTEIRSFQLAKMRGSVQKGELLKLLLGRGAPEHRGLKVGDYAESLGIKRQYVYELIQSAEDIRALAPLIEATQTPLVAAQAAVLAPIYREDPDAAALVLEAAKETGKLSAASLKQAATDLGQRTILPDVSSAQTQQPRALPAAATAPRLDTLYKEFAPKAVARHVQENPAALLERVTHIEDEMNKLLRRVEAARRAAQKALNT
ncbi:hypothetical protein [Streptomyces nitrosporeus]|uniref:hypothetical protein n=1 Tax=Streptomyces nitrosporeus TaxID=28894 RepID=UPI0039A31D5C